MQEAAAADEEKMGGEDGVGRGGGGKKLLWRAGESRQKYEQGHVQAFKLMPKMGVLCAMLWELRKKIKKSRSRAVADMSFRENNRHKRQKSIEIKFWN
jgi:hypothetical protein